MYTNTSWVDREFEQAFISDSRLVERLVRVAKKLAANPEASIPQALGGWKETKAYYRMLDNNKISDEVILSGHTKQTIQRMKNHDVVLSIQDSTGFNFTHHPATEGLGPYTTNRESVGMHLHSALAVTTQGVALGLLHQKYWVRDAYDPKRNHNNLPIEEKESYKWIETLNASLRDIPPETKVVTVCDRESDIYEFFQHCVSTGNHFLVRVEQDRKVVDENGTTISKVLEHQQVEGEIIVQVPRNTRENVPSRQARIQVKFCKVTVRPPQGNKFTKDAPNLELYSILAEETSIPPEGVKPIRWLLLTDIAVESLEDAVEKIQWYAQRWKIERFHYILKSGCGIKDLQLETGDRLGKAIAVYSIVSWKILFMTYESRENPDESCESVFKEHEWQALYCFVNETPIPPKKALTIREATFMVASLGGFLGRKSDGYPGVKVLWRGMARLNDIAKFWYITHSPSFSNDVGNA